MNRKDWKFAYTAATLAEAADAKLRHHHERLEFWKAKKTEVIGLILPAAISPMNAYRTYRLLPIFGR